MAQQVLLAPGEIDRRIADLEHEVRFREPEAVRTFLRANPDLLAVLDEARREIPRFFPNHPAIVLAMVFDPDDEDSSGQLFALIPTTLQVEEARSRLALMDREWWLGTLQRVAGRLNVSIAFV